MGRSKEILAAAVLGVVVLVAIVALRATQEHGNDGIDSTVTGDCGDTRLTRQIEDLKEMNHYKGAHFVIECTLGGAVSIINLVAGDSPDPRCRQRFELHYVSGDDDLYAVYTSHFERRSSVGEILPIAINEIAAADC